MLLLFGPPYKKGDIEAIEKIQKRATKLVISVTGHWSERALVRRVTGPKLYSRTFRGGAIQTCIPFHTHSRRPIFSLPGSADFAMTRSCSVDRD